MPLIWGRPKFKDGNKMSKLLLGSGGTVHQARAVHSRFTLYVHVHVQYLGYRNKCRAAGPLDLNMLKQPGWAEDYRKHGERFFFSFFLRLPCVRGPSDQKAADPCPKPSLIRLNYLFSRNNMYDIIISWSVLGLLSRVYQTVVMKHMKSTFLNWLIHSVSKSGVSIGMRERGRGLDCRIL